MSLTPFNDLPPKPEYVAKIKAALSVHRSLPLQGLIAQTALTKTQVLCAAELLIKQRLIERAKDTGEFSLATGVRGHTG